MPEESQSISGQPAIAIPSEQNAQPVHESSQKLKSARLEKAAQLLAEDKLSDDEIAEQCGVTRRALAKWKLRPEVKARIEFLVDAFSERMLKRGLARRERRIEVLRNLHDRALRVIEERAEYAEADDSLKLVPGMTTGLVVETVKGVGVGDDFEQVKVYHVDTGLLKEIRAIQEQVADELGQKPKRVELSGPEGGPIEVNDAREKLFAKLAG